MALLPPTKVNGFPRLKTFMKNKYVLTRRENLNYIRENLDHFVSNALYLARYEEDDPLRERARTNFYNAYEFIMNSPEVENDYQCLLQLHHILMEGLDEDICSTLSDEQIAELSQLLNQPAKANVEIAIDAMIYILDRRLFADGDVRVAIMFANKFMLDTGCGTITVFKSKCEDFRRLYTDYRQNRGDEFKQWIYKYCVRGPKVEYS